MATAKKTTATKPASPSLPHVDDCTKAAGRVESYDVLDPAGDQVRVTRCVDCGAQEVK